MQRRYDPLTYRHPRTSIDAFGCDPREAVAWHVYKTSFARRFWIRNKTWIQKAGKVFGYIVLIWAALAVLFLSKGWA